MQRSSTCVNCCNRVNQKPSQLESLPYQSIGLVSSRWIMKVKESINQKLDRYADAPLQLITV